MVSRSGASAASSRASGASAVFAALLAISVPPVIYVSQRCKRAPRDIAPRVPLDRQSLRSSPLRPFGPSTDSPSRCAVILALLFQQRLHSRPGLVRHVLCEIAFRFDDLHLELGLLKLISDMDPPHPHRFGIRIDPRECGVGQDLWR